MYRDRLNDRLLCDDTAFSDFIFNRIKPFLPDTIVKGQCKKFVHEMQLDGLNARWRYCRYFAKHYFNFHTDGMYSPPYSKPLVSSYLTMVMYLNGPEQVDAEIPTFVGGSTCFAQYNNEKKLIYECVPDCGKILFFVQEDVRCLHNGALVEKGTKYIIRNDVMYKSTK